MVLALRWAIPDPLPRSTTRRKELEQDYFADYQTSIFRFFELNCLPWQSTAIQLE
ncbi:hypothetical protein SAMN06265222_103347 [Neorhodopirellula lusitana]|uniref:Uncharacterized protein n=1 Tax=Neorhodopirellula lusitana TaxID=445327 RepID=A0ABY1PX33_9BACT|nr:hypothetical protein SAMN06265222_103347 [Neorhodopirellula lusitana]